MSFALPEEKQPDEATEALLELRAEESIQMCLEHAESSKETRAVIVV